MYKINQVLTRKMTYTSSTKTTTMYDIYIINNNNNNNNNNTYWAYPLFDKILELVSECGLTGCAWFCILQSGDYHLGNGKQSTAISQRWHTHRQIEEQVIWYRSGTQLTKYLMESVCVKIIHEMKFNKQTNAVTGYNQ